MHNGVSLRRLYDELYWGQRLMLLKIHHMADGFRGKAKGQGFEAYLKAEGIPRRRAYRLIRRYHEICVICRQADAENAGLFAEVIPPLPAGFPEKLQTALDAMRDNDSVTNEAEVTQ